MVLSNLNLAQIPLDVIRQILESDISWIDSTRLIRFPISPRWNSFIIAHLRERKHLPGIDKITVLFGPTNTTFTLRVSEKVFEKYFELERWRAPESTLEYVMNFDPHLFKYSHKRGRIFTKNKKLRRLRHRLMRCSRVKKLSVAGVNCYNKHIVQRLLDLVDVDELAFTSTDLSDHGLQNLILDLAGNYTIRSIKLTFYESFERLKRFFGHEKFLSFCAEALYLVKRLELVYISIPLSSRSGNLPEYSRITDGNFEVLVEDIYTEDGRHRLTFSVCHRVRDEMSKNEDRPISPEEYRSRRAL